MQDRELWFRGSGKHCRNLASLVAMEAAHLKELVALEQGYWWHVAKRRLATQMLSEHVPLASSEANHSRPLIIEGGIGAGGNLLHWQSCGYQVSGLDIMPASIEHARQLGLNDVRVHDLHEPWPYENGTASAVVLLDVLEHLKDPVLALKGGSATSCRTMGR